MKWIAFFSQTGTEILNVSKKLGKLPDKIITNASVGSINKELIASKPVIFTIDNPSPGDYRQLIEDSTDTIITLHGWLRIIPPEICKEYTIWNLHPGLITRYPELKGKDPQKKVIESKKKKYEQIGLVIHRVIPEVDAGNVELEMSTCNTFYNVDSLTSVLHEMATSAWLKFFSTRNECY